MKFEFKCPRCGAPPNGHGKGRCDNDDLTCMGFLCECDDECDSPTHGQTLNDPCDNAVCYHCGWSGVFPKKLKGLQAWEKKALNAGWTMPSARAKELSQK